MGNFIVALAMLGSLYVGVFFMLPPGGYLWASITGWIIFGLTFLYLTVNKRSGGKG